MASSVAPKAQPDAVALFVSDVHLQASLPRTTEAFFNFLNRHAKKARQLYLLGDMFEYWAGDDDIIDPYNQQVVEAIRQVSDAGVAVYWMAGNRDFLVGEEFARSTGATLLPDPFVTTIANRRVVLVHGDAQCTDDTAYMSFRAQVRQPAWQNEFLAKPLAQRKAIIAGLRAGSREAQRSKSYEIMDVNAAAIAALFESSGASTIIHGHTHRPAHHEYGDHAADKMRYVLPDWDCDIDPPRGGWLAIDATGAIRTYGIDETQK